MFDHKMLWFEGKNWTEKWLVFARFFCPFLKMQKGKKVVLGVIWRKIEGGSGNLIKIKYGQSKEG